MDELRGGELLTPAEEPMAEPMGSSITAETLAKWERTLNEYKAGKASVDRRIKAAEKWWKLRNFETEVSVSDPKSHGFRSQTAWLHNIIVNKHADAIEAYPSPNFLPREEGDKPLAWALSEIVPAVLDMCDFESVYDEEQWAKLKTGTGVYKVVWDGQKANGLGDIAVNRVDVLNLFWEPGIKDIQKSRMVFHVEMVDIEVLEEEYPQLKDKGLRNGFQPAKQPTDDHVPDADKAAVIDVYYHKYGKLQYCKYVGDTVLYASEDDPMRRDGFYQHNLYPFVFDVLFPVEGSPCGYGYVDIAWNSQTCIDLMDTAILRNTMAAATPRYFVRSDGGVNEQEFTDLEKALIHTTGNLGEDSIRVVNAPQLSGNYNNALAAKVNELRETSGNTETSTGNISAGVTAASAIAALQEASNKGSRASTLGSYRAFKTVAKMVMELIRQFYDQPRQFRITGTMGQFRFVPFDNAMMLPQYQGMMGGVDLGYRVPEFDIEIVPQKATRYTKLSQNELAKEMYALHLFDPQNFQQALMCLQMMDFDGKDELMRSIQANGMMFTMQMQMMQAAMPAPNIPGKDAVEGSEATAEEKRIEKTKDRVRESAQPGGGDG